MFCVFQHLREIYVEMEESFKLFFSTTIMKSKYLIALMWAWEMDGFRILTWNREFSDPTHRIVLNSHWYSIVYRMLLMWNEMESILQYLFHRLAAMLLLLISRAAGAVDLVGLWIWENTPAKHDRPIAVFPDPLMLLQNVMNTRDHPPYDCMLSRNLWFVFPTMRPILHHSDICFFLNKKCNFIRTLIFFAQY